jgi:hypothetical protein
MPNLYEHHGVVTPCHHPSYCGTIENEGILWDIYTLEFTSVAYTLGFTSVATNGKRCKALKEPELARLVDRSKVLCWVG